jgi:uncharacterized protein
MYPFAGFPDNLTAFCAALRREYGFHIGPGELVDAARALDSIDVTAQQAVRDVLRPVLSSTADDAAVFDEAFTRFFLPRPVGQPPDRMPARRRLRGGADQAVHDRPVGSRDAHTLGEETNAALDGSGGVTVPLEGQEGDLDETMPGPRARYSPLEVDGPTVPDTFNVDPAWLDAAGQLVRRVHLGLSRRWRPAPRGRRFDTRRTMRTSLRTGGEMLAPRWKKRRQRAPRFVLLIDGSRSMSAYASTGLRIGAALASVTRRVEVFTFSTALQRVTDDVRQETDQRGRRGAWNQRAWGGGTSIGLCLRTFLRGFGAGLLGPTTVVMLCSDGLDVGEPETLRAAMRDLRSRAAAIVWLNPLLETPGYAPTARGMTIARPYVTTFTSANDLDAFVRLARTILVRA